MARRASATSRPWRKRRSFDALPTRQDVLDQCYHKAPDGAELDADLIEENGDGTVRVFSAGSGEYDLDVIFEVVDEIGNTIHLRNAKHIQSNLVLTKCAIPPPISS